MIPLLAKLATRLRPVFLPAAALAVCAAWLASFAAEARAECGDYVHVRQPSGAVGALGGASSTRSAPLPGRSAPCRGPACSKNNVPLPTSPAVPRSGADRELWAERLLRLAATRRERNVFPHAESDVMFPAPLRQRVDRPPICS